LKKNEISEVDHCGFREFLGVFTQDPILISREFVLFPRLLKGKIFSR